MRSSLLSVLTCLAYVLATPHASSYLDRYGELAKRGTTDLQLQKRFSGSKWTFYDVGLGGCGQVNVESDFIVALNADVQVFSFMPW